MAIDGSKLQSALTVGERWQRTLEVTIPHDEIEKEEKRIIRDLSSRIRLPGFRSGKIPTEVIRRRFGNEVRREMLDQVISDAYKSALEREELSPINEGSVSEVAFEPGEDFRFEVTFEVAPELELTQLDGFRVERPRFEVSDADVDSVIEELRGRNGSWEPVEEGAPVEGDMVSVSIANLSAEEVESRDYEIVLGGGDAIPEVEEAIRTLEPGREEEFTVHFPDNFPDEARRGAEQRLRIRLANRKVRRLPELTDEFVAEVGGAATIDELRARIREDLEREAAQRAEGAVRSRLADLVVEANPFDVPRSMVERYVRSILGEKEPEPEQLAQAVEALGAEAEKAVKRILLIEELSEKNQLRATEEELDERIEEIAAANEVSPSEVYAGFQKSGRLDSLEREITEKKVFDFLLTRSEVVDAA